jgi:preprotein translocase subunit SecE
MSENQPKASLPVPNMKRGRGPFIAGLKRELKKVSWPTHKETNRLFGVVLAVCVLLVGVLGVIGVLAQTLINLITGGAGK